MFKINKDYIFSFPKFFMTNAPFGLDFLIFQSKGYYLMNPRFGESYIVNIPYREGEFTNFKNKNAVYLNTRDGKMMFYFIENGRLQKAVSKIDDNPLWLHELYEKPFAGFRGELIGENDLTEWELKWVAGQRPELKSERLNDFTEQQWCLSCSDEQNNDKCMFRLQ
jgi:hypothetical protein